MPYPMYEWIEYAEQMTTELLRSVPSLGPRFFTEHMQVCKSVPEFIDGAYWIVTVCLHAATIS